MNCTTEQRKERIRTAGNQPCNKRDQGVELAGVPFLFPPRLYDQRLGIKIFRRAKSRQSGPERSGQTA